ncbi:hypothetical protein [Aquariibacter albus]|uniref:Uncharacterized protein n=1 Tax=Aquariibacter albus TaxID=2759899 RepID=A0A839HR12_9BURK|nr:hypothetical protein [Aquariibacter albus]MBB1161481.1 hypothetical protein [Aquariibacter albus]
MLDRALQKLILETLASAYPEGEFDLPAAIEAAGHPRPDDRALLVNTQYLAEHELLESGYQRRGCIGDNSFMPMGESVITARGLDFLADDGGLGAILGVVTMRLDSDTLRALLAERVDATDLPAAEKSRIKAALLGLGKEAWSEAARRLVCEGLDRWPEALSWLQTLRG